MSVSAILTCFNIERYIAAAIESARTALAGREGEIIVVDDCSTDGSAAIIQSYGDVTYLRTRTNGGVMLATLDGIAAARFPILAFLDGDDIWHADKLAEVEAAFASAPDITLVTHDLEYVDASGRPLPTVTRPGRSLARVPQALWSEHLRQSVLQQRDDIWLGSALSVHRDRGRISEFAALIRARVDASELYQDWPMAAWLAVQPGARFAYIPRKLFGYRLHGANHSGDVATAARAKRNFERARNTLRAMADITASAGQCHAQLRSRLALAEAQASLYAGRKCSALSWFARSLSGLVSRPASLAKETFRLAALGLMGVERGHALTRRIGRAGLYP